MWSASVVCSLKIAFHERSGIAGQLDPRIVSVLEFVTHHIDDVLSLGDLARVAGMSRFSFCRLFHRAYGVSPMRWLWQFRLSLAKELTMVQPHWLLTDVAIACGFTSSAHFSRAFRSQFGMSPTAMRENLGRLEIRSMWQETLVILTCETETLQRIVTHEKRRFKRA